MFINLLLIGIVSILGQVIILRELSVAFYGIELIYILTIGIWLLWTGIGALIGRKSRRHGPGLIVLLFILMGITLPLDMAFIRGSRVLFGGVRGAYLPFIQQLIIISLALLPICLNFGILFQKAAKLYVRNHSRTLASAYAIESAGGVIGGLLSTLFLKFGVQNLNIALICAIFAFSAAFVYQDRRRQHIVRLTAALFIFTLVMASLQSSNIDRWMTGWNHPNLLDSRDTPYGRITVRSLHDQLSIFENDALNFETEGTTAEEFAHLSALHHDDPKRILLLGGGIEGLIRELLKYSPQQIDYVELNSRMLNMLQQHIPSDIRNSLTAENVRVITADPRRYIEDCESYDLIISAMPEPTSGQTNRFYTREFFKGCAAKLNPGGILTFRLRASENLWTPQLKLRTVSIFRALKTEFSHATVLPGVTNIIIASNEPLQTDPVFLGDRLARLGISTKLIIPEYIRYLYSNDRFHEVKEIIETTFAPVNSDDLPICYQYAVVIWLSQFYPQLAFHDMNLSGANGKSSYISLGILFSIIILTFILLRWRFWIRRIVLVGVAGFIGMVMETLLILHYQTKSGILYQDIGLLLTAFMLGLTTGAYLTNRWIRPASLSASPPSSKNRWRQGALLVVGFCLINALIMLTLKAPMMSSLIVIAIMLVLTGAFVAAVFAYASLDRISDQVSVISPLYAADLIGGCLGGLAGVLFLVPMIGLSSTAGLISGFAVVCLLLI